jgi:hypothetical protein
LLVLQVGRSGRLATICRAALESAKFDIALFFMSSDGGVHSDKDGLVWHSVRDFIRDHSQEKIAFIDASVDHSSLNALVLHEQLKRAVVRQLRDHGALWRAVGFSSGITCVNVDRISRSAHQMLEYRQQKLEQEMLFRSLDCPVFIPNLFTLIGRVTFERKSSAWVDVLLARLRRDESFVIHEPYSRRAWVGEVTVRENLSTFLSSESPDNYVGPMVSGQFSLFDIASQYYIDAPPLKYVLGRKSGWLDGDYVCPSDQILSSESVFQEITQIVSGFVK